MVRKGSSQYRQVRECSNCGHVWRTKISGYEKKCPHCRKPVKR